MALRADANPTYSAQGELLVCLTAPFEGSRLGGGWLLGRLEPVAAQIADRGTIEAEVIAQRGARVVLAVDAAALQFGHHEFDEVLETAGLMRWADDETVARRRGPPFLHAVGDLLRAADPGFAQQAAAGSLHEVAHGRVLALLDDAVAHGLHAVDGGELGVGEGFVEALLGEVVVERFRQQRELVDLVWQLVVGGLLVLGLSLGGSGDGIEQ